MRRTTRDRSGVRGGADRVRRDWGRVVSVRKRTAGRPVTVAAAIGATTVAVRNGVLFGDRGSVKLGDQVTKHTGWDENTGLLAIVDPLVAALEVGDRVFVYDRGRDTVVTDLEVLVDRDDDGGAPLPVYADAALATVLPPGPREAGEGEVVQIEYDPDDETWSITRAPGLSEAAGMKAEANDAYTLTTTDVTAGTATIPLTHAPVDESVKLILGGVPQEPTEYTVNYDSKTITLPLNSAWTALAGLRVWVHYWYVRGVVTDRWRSLAVPLSDTTNRSAVGFDDSSWALVSLPLSDQAVAHSVQTSWPVPSAGFPTESALWLRKRVTEPAGSLTLTVRYDDLVKVYWNGASVFEDLVADAAQEQAVVVTSTGNDVLAVRAADSDASSGGTDRSYIDVEIG